MRRSPRPSKQILWSLVEDFFERSEGYDVGVDIACGDMAMRPYFRTNSYVGIDLNAERVEEGRTRYPEVVGKVKAIEELDAADRGDFVVCLETIGSSPGFDRMSDPVDCMRRIVETTNPGGALLFNLGYLARDSWDAIDEVVREAFDRCSTRDYGSIHRELPVVLSYPLAWVLERAPSLDAMNAKFRLYFCEGRRPPRSRQAA